MNMDLDIGPLSWVKGEIDLALERAGQCLADSATDPADGNLQKACASMHQAHGALAIVGLDGITEFADAIEKLLDAMVQDSVTDRAAATTAAQGGFTALRGYLDDLMGGHPNQPLKLFASFQEMAVARGQAAPAPSELFFPDLTQRPPKREKDPAPLTPEALATRLKAARMGYERGLLKWIKNDPKGIAEMKVSVSMIELTRATPSARAYWWVTLGVLDALAANGLPDIKETKLFFMRLGGQIKKFCEGQTEIGENFLREALYQAACATAGGQSLAIVRAAYRLDGLVPSETPSETERLLPHLRRLRELLAAAKDDWNHLCAGSAAALPPFHDRTGKIADEGAATGQADYTRLTAAIRTYTDLLRRDPALHNDVVGLEIATALLLAESALENFQSLDAEFAHSTDVVVKRLAALGRGEELGTMELPHLDAMSRRAQERLLLESVAREIRSNLGVIEQTLDAFFRDTSRQSTLSTLKQPVRQIQGALMVLGQDRANAVLGECAQAIERFAEPGFSAQNGDFEDVAKKLSALGFFVTRLQGGDADIDLILEPPAPKVREPVEDPVVASPEEPPVTEEPAEAVAPVSDMAAPIDAGPGLETEPPALELEQDSQSEIESAFEEELPDFEVEGFEPPEDPPSAPAAKIIETPAPSAESTRMAEASEEDLDAELLGIFLEEANEVLATINQHLPLIHASPGDQASLVTLRRSFHTLKGSGRMVGLADLGESAWAVEQVMNGLLHDAGPASPDLIAMLDLAAELFRDWVVQLEAGGSRHFDDAELVRRCKRLGGADDAEADTAVTPAPTFSDDAAEVDAEIVEPENVAAEEAGPEEAVAELAPPEEEEQAASEDSSAAESVAPILPSAEVVSFPSPPMIRVGAVEIAPALFNLYVEETRGHVATLQADLGLEAVPGNEVIRAAHTTGSISAATGFQPLSTLARALEDALVRFSLMDVVPTDAQRFVFARCAGALEGMLGAVAERRMPSEEAQLTAELVAMAPARSPAEAPVEPPAEVLVEPPVEVPIEPPAEVPLEPPAEVPVEPPAEIRVEPPAEVPLEPPAEAPVEPPAEVPLEPPAEAPLEPTDFLIGAAADEASTVPEISVTETDRRTTRIEDEIDEQILPLFLEESVDLTRDIGVALREWRAAPSNADIPRSLQRALHTLKGSARMAGAMGCGELLHAMESRVEQAAAMNLVQPTTFDQLESSFDRAVLLIESLRNPGSMEPASDSALPATEHEADRKPQTSEQNEIARAQAAVPAREPVKAAGKPASGFVAAAKAHLRVRAELVDQLVNEAGEVAIARGRIEGELLALKASLLDLTENVIRMRKQLREVEIQAESQMQSQQALATERAQEFDPLEFDRFTRFQEVARMMAESVNDVSTVQQTLMRNLDHANAAVTAQARLSRELSQRLMAVRMVPFESIAERLHRVVRQAAKDANKRCNLDIRHGQTDLDRSVLDKMAGPLEHLLRNSVAHGLEHSATRASAGKPAIGQITLSLAQEGNEIVIIISDDGAGLDFDRIRQRGIQRGLISADGQVDEATLTQLILQPSFSTAENVTALSGRGVGLDVVQSEAASLGGRIEVKSVTGSGTTFRVYLPLTLTVTQSVLVTVGGRRYAIPSSMIEQATELKPDDAAEIRSAGSTVWLGNTYPYRYLGELLGDKEAAPLPGRRHWILLIKGGSDRVALEIDALSRNQEIVVKAIGPQLARVRGLAGATVLGNGEIALILNPVALISRSAVQVGAPVSESVTPEESKAVPAVMVVDDSLTVRKISGRLLARHGYQVLTAKDGVDALEQLTDVLPDVMLLDIEMPRMDGFDLARNIRGDSRMRHIPIIMITSRTADKHRLRAEEIGVNHYLGKPYDEDDLLACIRQCLGKK